MIARSAGVQRAAQYPTWPHLVREDLAVEPVDPCRHVGLVGEQLDTDATQLVEHDATRHFGGANEHETHSLRQEYSGFHELSHDERRCDNLERQIEDVQHIGQQAGVVVLLEFHVHPFGRYVVAAVVSVGFAEPHAETFGLVQLGGGQQKEELPVDTRIQGAAGAGSARTPAVPLDAPSGQDLPPTPRRTPPGCSVVDSAGRPHHRDAPGKRDSRQSHCRSSCFHSLDHHRHVPLHEGRPCPGRALVGRKQREQPRRKNTASSPGSRPLVTRPARCHR